MTDHELHFFNIVAPEWDSRDTLSKPEAIDRLLTLGGVKECDSILDLGTGTGVLLPYLARRVGACGSITAVDLSEGMLTLAKAKAVTLVPHPQFLQTDFEAQRLPGMYDHIIMYCVYPHLEHPVKTLRRLRRENLQPGGNILIAFPTEASRINAIHHRVRVDHHYLPSPRELTTYLRAHHLPARVLADDAQLFLVAVGG